MALAVAALVGSGGSWMGLGKKTDSDQADLITKPVGPVW